MTEFELTGAQLYECARQFGIARLLLPGDPFQGWLVEEIEEALDQAHMQLQEVGLVHQSDEGSVQVDEELAITLHTLEEPLGSVLFSRVTPDEMVSSGYLHQGEDVWVWLEPSDGGEFYTKLISGVGNASQALSVFLNIDGKAAAPGDPFSLEDDVVREARRLASDKGMKACQAYLEASGISDGVARAFAIALVDPVSSGSVVAMTWEGTQARPTGGMAFLEGPEGLWQLTSGEKTPDWIRVEPITGGEITDSLECLLETFKRV